MNRIKARKIIEKLRNENEKWLKSTREASMDGIFSIIRRVRIEKKKDFILELIQNADDCNSTEISMDLDSSKITIQNDGDPFRSNPDRTKDNIFAICKLGKSTKESGKIGFMGFGFRAVFEVSEKPKVFSGHFSFYFNKDMIVPHWIERYPDYIKTKLERTKGRGSVFVLPYLNREIFKDVKQAIKSLSPNLLLYLQNLKKIRIGEKLLQVEKAALTNSYWASINGKKRYLWKIYSKKIQIPQTLQSFLRKDRDLDKMGKPSKKYEYITIAFEITPDGKVVNKGNNALFAFLPLADETNTRLGFNIQADFSVDAGRRKLREPNSKWNQWILSNVSKFIPLMIKDFKNNSETRTEFYKVLPLEDPDRPDYLHPVKEKIDEIIRKKDSILVKTNRSIKYPDGKKWVKPENAIIADIELQKLFDSRDLKRIFGRRKFYVANDEIDDIGMKHIKEIVKDELSFDKIIELLIDSKWILERKIINKKHPEKWVGDLVIYFSKELDKSWIIKEELSKTRFILDEKGKLCKPRKVFLPASDKIDIPSRWSKKYKIVSPKLIRYLNANRIKNDELKDERRMGLDLLMDLVSELSPETIVREIINPIFADDIWKRCSDPSLRRYTEFVMEHRDCWSCADIKIKAKTDGRKRFYKKPNELYLPYKYGNDFKLDSLFKGFKYENLVSSDYIQKIKKSKSNSEKTQLKKWKDFLIKLGVKEFPLIQKISKSKSGKDLEVELKAYRPHDNINRSNWGYTKNDYDICSPLNEIFNKCAKDEVEDSYKRLRVFIRIIDRKWTYYKSFLKSRYLYHTTGAHGWTEEDLGESSFAIFLKSSNWIPTEDGRHFRPGTVALNELKGKVKTPVIDYKISNEEFKDYLQSLGLQTKLTVEGAIALLKSHIEHRETKIYKYKEIYGYLSKHEKEKKKIRSALKEVPCIFMPKHKKKYWKISDTFWEAEDSFSDWKTDVGHIYPKFRNLFINIFGIKEKPTHEDYANFLSSYLWTKEALTNREKSCLGNIYHHLNYITTTPELKKSETWKNLKVDFKIWCENNQWAGLNEKVYYNDKEELCKLFRKHTDILLAYIPKNVDRAEIKKLFSELGIRSLANNYKEECSVSGKQINADVKYQNAIRRISKYIARFIKAKSPQAFNKLNEQGAFIALSKVDLKFADNIRVDAVIDDYTIYQGKRKCFYAWRNSNNILFLDMSILGERFSCYRYVGIALAHAFERNISLEMYVPLIVEGDEIEINNAMLDYEIITKKELNELKKKVEEKQEKPIIGTEKPGKAPAQKQFDPAAKPKVSRTRFPDIIPMITEKDEWQPECPPEKAAIQKGEILYSPNKKYETSELKTRRKKFSPPSAKKEDIAKDILSPKTKKKIGHWGEKYTIEFLKNKYRKKIKKGIIKETKDGFAVYSNKMKAVQVFWMNKKEDKSEGYDIKVNEDKRIMYIEVKSTKTDAKEFFEISRNQWEFAKQKRDKFHIYRVYNAGSKQEVKVIDIHNPVKLWQEGNLAAYPIRIQL